MGSAGGPIGAGAPRARTRGPGLVPVLVLDKRRLPRGDRSPRGYTSPSYLTRDDSNDYGDGVPIVQITYAEGPTPEQRRRLITTVTEAVVRELEVPAEVVNVVLTPVPRSEWGHAGVPLSEKLPPS